MSLSDFDLMLRIRLPEWGRWGRQDGGRPDPEAGSGAIYRMGRADGQGDMITSYRCAGCMREQPDDGKCKTCGLALLRVDERIPAEPPPPGIDHARAERTDRLIHAVSDTHKHVIRSYFYLRNESFRHRVPEAIRALLDVEECAWTK